MDLTKAMYQALGALVINPSVLTATVVDKLLWKYHKAVASKLEIPTTIGQWFRTLVETNPVSEQQRDAIEIVLSVVKYNPTKESIKQAMASEYVKPLLDLHEIFNDAMAKRVENNTNTEEDSI
jgi:hypothetical protein